MRLPKGIQKDLIYLCAYPSLKRTMAELRGTVDSSLIPPAGGQASDMKITGWFLTAS